MATKIRRARKSHRCQRGCEIKAGDEYIDERRHDDRGKAFRWCWVHWVEESGQRESDAMHEYAMANLGDKWGPV